MASPISRTASAIAAACLSALLILPEPAAAQPGSLEQQRQAVFAQLLQSPADRSLMLSYARLSVQLRDYEAAASTLERLVDLEPGNVGARVELAVAYFALGAYDVAEYHLAAAAASGALTPEQAAEVARYREEAADRDATHRFSGRIAVGQGRTTEADLDGRFGSARLEWRIDMGGRNASDWLTELSFNSYQPGEFTFAQREVLRLRTGPELRITGAAFGPRLQPYVELTRLREDNFFFTDGYDALAFGVAYQNPHSAQLTSYADIQIGQAESINAFGGDFDFRDVSLGLGYRPSRDTRIRGTLGWREEDYDGFFVETTRSLSVEALHEFRLGSGADSMVGLPRRWEARGFLRRAEVEEDFGFVDEYTDTIWGAGLRAFFTEEFFVEVRGSRLDREFSFGFTQEETFYGLQIGWEF